MSSTVTSIANSCCFAIWEGDEWYHNPKCSVGKALRDSWCTDGDIARALGRFTLDPCSNPRSLIRADRTCELERGEDGLAISWKGEDVYINGPFSDLFPWAEKAAEARSVVAMVNSDHSTKWWKRFVQSGCLYEFKFDKRRAFIPPPHIKPSTNSKPQSLLCTWNAAVRIDKAIVQFGSWWMARGPDVDS